MSIGFPKESAYETSATLFSLSFPLDDICPVAINQGGIVNIFNNNNYKIVFTSERPSICMIYDVTTKQHSVFRIRKIRADEGDFGDKMMSGLYSINHSNKVRRGFWHLYCTLDLNHSIWYFVDKTSWKCHLKQKICIKLKW